nr:protein eyes shut homolog isoform X1 [Anolis sagrei ordinatus]
MKLKSAIVVIVLYLQSSLVDGQTICKRYPMISEWQTQPRVHTVKWSLTQDICSKFYTDCWSFDSDHAGNVIENMFLNNPQICPLQIQLGDAVFISSEPSFQSHGMNLANVTMEEFLFCPRQADVPQTQLIFGCRLSGMHQIDPKWLGTGTHYFAEVSAQGPRLCPLGLRLNVTVKPHLCQQSPSAPFCSGRGKCLSQIWDETYNCYCKQSYSGQFCQEFDVCSSKPCYNNASCIGKEKKGEHGEDSYECICPPLFAGKNCTEIIGQCQPSTCLNGNCSNISPNTYRCQCNKDTSGPFCEEQVESCVSQPCQNGAICYNTPSSYICDCPAGFLGQDCETDINECFSRPCQNGGTCTDMPNDVSCSCLLKFIGKFCEKSATPCDPSPCLNNGSCTEKGENYQCSCMPGHTGRNCEQVIDYCRLLSINCLNEGLCLNIIGGFSCLCAPGWVGEFCQIVEDACLIYPDNCHAGATCVDVSPSKLQPQIECVCAAGFTGVSCETEINECESDPCKHGGTCDDSLGHFKCICPVGFEGVQCEINIDACLFNNITCNPGAQCVDKPYELSYMCGKACKGNSELCENGGRCYHNEDNQDYQCICAPGWTGPTCSQNINDCEVSWCQNGGTCEDGINEYRCLCPPGYSGTFCERVLDPCFQNRCSDHGFCLPNLNNYTCQCRLGYEGPFCEVEANECSSSPCKNGATCLDLIGHFSCQCAAGFKGETCAKNVGSCVDQPCQNGATCEDTTNGLKCNCPFGFEGLNCEINFDDCSYHFCKNNSTCLDLVADYACICPPGFTDKNCSMDIDECAVKPCKNGASCHNVIGKFYCNCLPGFTGEFCETNIGGCMSNPCGAYNLCKDTLDGYHCFCAPGFIGNNCEIEVDECLSGPCHNGGTCVEHLNAFRCLCPYGFQGTLCEININECHSNPCLHNATCTDLISGYDCSCLPGFTGLHCETDIDECASFPCKNGGTCIDQPGNYYCQCVAPFKGVNCEFRPCEAGNPCENGAICLKERDLASFPFGFQCQCKKGFAGPRCEININECSSSPCLHGYCYDVVDGFYCLCNPGYAGPKCDQDIDDCLSNACKHNSTCMDLHLGYKCLCPPGWEGSFCETEVNECDSVPCENNGTCIDLFNDFRCVCAEGWTGQWCSEDINECDSEPCLNGATCYESIVHGQFLCVCPPFYIGKICQYRYNPCSDPYNPCINNSTCLAQVDGKPLCICPKGFGGSYCEIDNNECASSPCQNQGRCVDGFNSYRCLCREGFSGTLCEVEINECASNPCTNSGTCLDLINRFLCNCPPGYYGLLCELDVNECEILPCLHGGSCFNHPGGYQCVCAPGFTGNQCEVDIDECNSAPCLNNGSCVDDINFYKCYCRSGFLGINCEINADECLSAPCHHGRCIDLIDGYQCYCEAGWTSSRCEIDIHECESVPCLNGGSCQDLVNAFECICLSGYTGEFCEVDIDVCVEPLLNSSLCFNGGKCVDGPGRTFYCRCPDGFSGHFCEIDINECSSSPCLHDSICEDLINGFFCRCQRGWEGFHCEDDINECASNPCIHGICTQKEPGLGYTCYCDPGFVGQSCELNYDDCLMQTCPVGYHCVDGINNITCFPDAPWRPQATMKMDREPSAEPLKGGFTQGQSSLIIPEMSPSQTSADILTSQLLGYIGLSSRGTKFDITAVAEVMIDSSPDATLVMHSEDKYDGISFIIKSLMTVPLPSSQRGLSVANHEILTLPAIDTSSAISNMPETKTESNSYSLFSPGSQLATPAIVHSTLSILFLPREITRQQLAISITSEREDWVLLKPSMTFIFPSEKTDLEKVDCFSSSVIQGSKRQISLPNEYLDISMSSLSHEITELLTLSTCSLSNLNQTCMKDSIVDIKFLDESSDHVLHSKESLFYQASWVYLTMLTSWYTLIKSTAVTSGYSFVSTSETAPSMKFKKVSSWYPAERGRDKSRLEEYVKTTPLQGLNTGFSCIYSDCIATVLSETFHLEPSFSTIKTSQGGNSYVTRKLIDVEKLTSMHILPTLNNPLYDPIKEMQPLMSQEDTIFVFQSSEAPREENDSHVACHSDEYTAHMPIRSEGRVDLHLRHAGITQTGPVADFLDRHSLCEFSVDRISDSVLSDQLHSVQTHYVKISMPQYLLTPDENWVALTMDSTLQHHLSTHATNEASPQSHSILASTVISYQFTMSDFSYIQYQGDSYMEFQGFALHPHNNISLEFQTTGFQGVLLHIEQNPTTMGHFFIQLSVMHGILQYEFSCDEWEEIRNINTNVRVDDGQKYRVYIRQDLVICAAEVTVLEITTKRSMASNHCSSLIWQETGAIFIGGLPHRFAMKQVTGSVFNFTGCIEVKEINNQGPFTFPNAVDRNNVDSCRFPASNGTSGIVLGTVSAVSEALKSPPVHPALSLLCQENLCQNGGTCHQMNLWGGVTSFRCDCPLHFTGRFCEKDTTLFFPSFSPDSYLELPSLTSLSEDGFATGQEWSRMTIYLTVKTNALNGTLLYTRGSYAGEHFLHLYLLHGRPTLRVGYGNPEEILTMATNHSINSDALVPITIRYILPLSKFEGYGLIEMTANESSPVRQEISLQHQLTQVTFGPVFLGNVPHHVKIHPSSGWIHGFRGCIREFQVNNKELFIIDEALGGRNIENCNVPICDYHPCRNGGTCTSDTENWFCECSPLYSGKLCQFSTCAETPCGNGATCVPKSDQDTICLCPYGRTGILCNDAINITYPSFSGIDAFGYTSFLAYSAIPNISLHYEFHLKFQLSNNNYSIQDNLIFFTGQKGQGLNGDDFLVLGLRNGSVVYSYNLGSGTATIISEPLDLTRQIHIVRLGRCLQDGWMKVDDQENKTITSPGKLVGLNVFSQFYVGGYIEYIPELLPYGSIFKNGFQGCIFYIQVRSGRAQKFKAPGIPEGHPNAGRNVGQCEESPCQLIKCKNGGTCLESGSTLYCRCPTGWKGAFCTETISVCDPEHNPLPKCQQGSTCVPLPDGYSCHCPLGTTGVHCEQALAISDASFSSKKSSWMAFDSFNIRHKVHIQIQFQTLLSDGILFYTAQHLSPRSGDFLSISLANGYVQLRYNLGDRIIILQTFQNVLTSNNTWYLIKAGRVGNEGYLDLDGINITQKASSGMTALDTRTDFYVGGVTSLNLVNPMAIQNEPTGFTGCIREILVNNKELKLTENGAKRGSNVGDCDGTFCGYKVCKNNGKCQVENSGFSCLCPKNWVGKICEQSTYCSHNKCLHGGICKPNPVLFSYTCICKLGWSGFWCEKQVWFFTAKFTGNSYIKYVDPKYKTRDLRFTRVSFNFTTTNMDGLFVWLGKTEDEDNDFLAAGLDHGMLKVVVNLGEKTTIPLIHQGKSLCCTQWHFVTIAQEETHIKVYLDEELVLFEDIDPQRKYSVLNYEGICYFGGFGLDREVNIVTSGLFNQALMGKIKDVALFRDSRKVMLIKGEGYNVLSGDKD